MNSSPISYLALGDSYTIGEAIPGPENFPNQVRSQLRIKGLKMEPPLIIAKTGWTTDELEQGIAMASGQDSLKTSYDFVSLLIGVNDQYRGRNAAAYAPNFSRLLQQAIGYAGSRPERVIVLSIPDWGITPFAADRNREQIALEIDEFNAINRKIAKASPNTKQTAIKPTVNTTVLRISILKRASLNSRSVYCCKPTHV